MDNKLFIFGIGGTGVRVIKALTMLLASGVYIKSSQIIPIIIDPHQDNQDLQRTHQLLRNYQKIYKILREDNNGAFFNTKITTLPNLISSEERLGENFTFNLKDVADFKFKQYIDHTTLDDSNKALVDLLFSEANLETVMDIGFVGNPNIGSVVLNQIKDSDEFKHFASNFKKNDRIFIVSSIFGGTGAAGFPILLNNIRSANSNDNIKVTNSKYLSDAKIGALTMLPYFGVEPVDQEQINEEKGNRQINKETFISKTKAALDYYCENITGHNQSVNAFYYIGDENTKDYKNDPGDHGQKNDAHFVELAAALAIIDFMNIGDEDLVTENGQALSPIYKEFGVKADKDSLNLLDLGDHTQQMIMTPLTQFFLCLKYLDEELETTIRKGQPWVNRKQPNVNKQFLTSSFYRNLKQLKQSFDSWLQEMGRNHRSFKPFRLNQDISNCINEIESNRKFTYNTFNSSLNEVERKQNHTLVEHKVMALFEQATMEILTKKFSQFK